MKKLIGTMLAAMMVMSAGNVFARGGGGRGGSINKIA